MKYGFIGLGSMASAIIKGMYNSNQFSSTSIHGYNRSVAKTNHLADNYGLIQSYSVKEIMSRADVIVLAVHPQSLPEILPDVQKYIQKNHLIISVAAGKSIDFLQQNIQENAPIIRVMPNINAIVGASTTCYSISSTVNEQHKEIVASLFGTIGSIIELPENLFTIFSAIGGASPAFTYLYIDSLARAAVREGMDKKMALEIAASSVLGSAKMILESNEHPWELVDQVCSPGGTTIQGVTSLQNDHFASTIYDAVTAVIKKDETLS